MAGTCSTRHTGRGELGLQAYASYAACSRLHTRPPAGAQAVRMSMYL